MIFLYASSHFDYLSSQKQGLLPYRKNSDSVNCVLLCSVGGASFPNCIVNTMVYGWENKIVQEHKTDFVIVTSRQVYVHNTFPFHHFYTCTVPIDIKCPRRFGIQKDIQGKSCYVANAVFSNFSILVN